MAESNYAALGEGLKLYTDAMRRLLKARLVAAYGGKGDKWWEAGVLDHLTAGQAQNVRANVKRDPTKDWMDHLDATHFARLVPRHFDSLLHGIFGDYDKTRSWLAQVATARTDWAHPRTGDMLADEVAHALYAMVQVLAAARLPEAEAVERIRKDVLGIGPAAPPAAGAPPPAPAAAAAHPPPAGEIPYWWQVCEPHDAFKDPTAIDESLFAATLGGVHAGAARPEYLDPAIFFSHTYFTENLRLTIRDVASRLRGGEGPSVTELHTPFGGGKTHALLTLYHLVKSPQRSLAVPGVREALGDVALPPNSRVLAFDGQELGTEPLPKQNGAQVWTLWGELAFQADPGLYDRLIAPVDSRREAPGNALYREVLLAVAPCLILIDEIVSYLVKLKFSSTRSSQNLYRQTVQFVQELLQQAGNIPGVSVLISLPKSRTEFGGLDPAQLQSELGIADELRARADRVVSKRTPVDDDEIYTLMSKRLFKKTDAGVGRQVALLYRAAYERTRAVYDPAVFSQDYLEHQRAAYPLHAELVDVLYKKWSTAGDFPRTRSVLQLLASVVADQWVNRREVYTIQSAHVNLGRERIRTKIVSAAGSGYDSVVAADIVGGDAHADALDQRRGGEYERHRVGRGIATTLLMHSFGGATRAGARPSDLFLGTVAPNVGPEYVSEILGSLEQSLWYVHREGELRRFETRANVYSVIAQRAKDQPAPTVAGRLQGALGEAIGSADGFQSIAWAAAEGAIPDRSEPTIAVLDARYAVSEENGGALAVRQPIDQLWEKAGGGLRQWRNALVLVAPDRELWAKAEEAMREVLAYESVIADVEKRSIQVSDLELKELKSRFKDKKESLRTSVTTAYRWVFYPDERGLSVVPLPVPATQAERIARRAVDRLAGQDYTNPKVMRQIGASFFNVKLLPRLWKDETSPLDLGETSRRFPQWTFLPILPNREATLRACLAEGVRNGLWTVAIGDNATMTYQRLVEKADELDTLVGLFDGSASLVRGELLELIQGELPLPAAGKHDASTGAVERTETAKPPVGTDRSPGTAGGKAPTIPHPPKRLAKLRIQLDRLKIGKTSNLQPYLFKVLQEQDAAAELVVTIDVQSAAGIPEDVLDRRIVEGFEQLGIAVRWERA
ncbi:MAG: ATP-binding protein [Chloroflexi bacterium]|nr:ATP-binding protein [Chloroflexota bacterium]